MAGKAQAAAQSHRATKGPGIPPDYSTSQLPEFARRPVGGSDKWHYVDTEYPEAYTS